jgi:hypothetical protein
VDSSPLGAPQFWREIQFRRCRRERSGIEKIVKRRPLADGRWQYRVRWEGYGAKDDLWYADEQLRGSAATMVDTFDRECEEQQLGEDMASMFRLFELEADRYDRMTRPRNGSENTQSHRRQAMQRPAYRTRYRTRARDKVTAAEQRAASTLLNLLEEPEPEQEPEPEPEPEPEHEQEPMEESGQGIGGLPTTKLCNGPGDVEKTPRSKRDGS